ncbi:MAG: hypothetical protein EHM45_15880 [Desulfobacteraceae bacterium]|nr:MAG: hypothetical protein EHM45_15880 [Desulfobacteraceae bacterium]
MEDYIKVSTLDNEIEAELLGSVLMERSIPHLIRSYHDTAYDGLFQVQLGFGAVSAPAAYKDEIKEILVELRKGSEESADPDPQP